ncbi:hypothetical protein [Rhodococcus sp. NPDC056516]|uniref:hypothetical protein n=1 Tax=Rhodococcus sp. NPDC056516 TaxID=3345847 RepID=UPI00366A8EC5
MSNTPTESEFDKELDHIMGWCSGEYHSPCWYKDNVIDKGLSVEEEDDLVRTAVRRMFDKYTQAKEREARIASVQLYMDTCENNSLDPSWESIHEFQDGQIKALADLEAEKETL